MYFAVTDLIYLLYLPSNKICFVRIFGDYLLYFIWIHFWNRSETFDLSSNLSHIAQWTRRRNWLVIFNISKTKLVMLHHHRAHLEFSPIIMDGGTLNQAPCLEHLLWHNHTLDLKYCIYNPLLKILIKKWLTLSTTPESIWHLLPCSIITRARSNQK